MRRFKLERIKSFFKGIVFSLFVLLFFVFASGLDFVVNSVLYDFGLEFSFSWALQYWFFYNGILFCFGFVISLAYWFGSDKTAKNFRVALALFLSIVLLVLGGLPDVLFFVFWGGGLPDGGVEWWWIPWYGLLGFWNSYSQLVLLSVTFVVVILLWVLVFRG